MPNIEPESGDPAWQRVTRGEPRWHVSLVVLAIIALQMMLPASIIGGFVPLVSDRYRVLQGSAHGNRTFDKRRLLLICE